MTTTERFSNWLSRYDQIREIRDNPTGLYVQVLWANIRMALTCNVDDIQEAKLIQMIARNCAPCEIDFFSLNAIVHAIPYMYLLQRNKHLSRAKWLLSELRT